MGLRGKPIAESTKVVWVTVSLGQETGITCILFPKTIWLDYKKLRCLDCLGIEE